MRGLQGAWLVGNREWRDWLSRWEGWLAAGLFLWLCGALLLLDALGGGPAPAWQVVEQYLYAASGVWMALSVYLGLGALAGERQAATLTLLACAPLSGRQVVYGKFLGTAAFLSVLLALSLYLPLLLALQGPLPWGQLAAGWLGLWLLGGVCLALSIAASAISPSRLRGGLLAGAGLAALLLPWMAAPQAGPFWGPVLGWLALHYRHFSAFSGGLVGLEELVYYGGLALLFLEAAVAGLAFSGWRGEARAARWRGVAQLGWGLLLLGALSAGSAKLGWRMDWAMGGGLAPGQESRQLLGRLEEPVEVGAFFRPGNPVGERVRGYLERVAELSPNVKPVWADAELEPDRALPFAHPAAGTPGNGTLVVKRGAAVASIRLGQDEQAARQALSGLDGRFYQALGQVASPPLAARYSVGHGEPALSSAAVAGLKGLLEGLNLNLQPLGLAQGLGVAIGAGAPAGQKAPAAKEPVGLLVMAAPRQPLQAGEERAIRDYLAGGGRLLLLLEPGTSAPAWLAGLGVGWRPAPVHNDRYFARAAFSNLDHAFLATSGYGPHPISQPLIQGAASNPVLLYGAGSLALPSAGPEAGLAGAAQPEGWRWTPLLRAMEGSWADLNGNHLFDAGTERREPLVLAGAGQGPHGARLVVVGDADLALDRLLSHQPNRALLQLSLEWLAGRQPGGPPPATAAQPLLSFSQSGRWLFLAGIFLPPLMLLLGARLVLFRRGG